MRWKLDGNSTGTFLQGYVDCSYADLVKVFGTPNSVGDGYKVDASWCLTFDNGSIGTIYNYKDGHNYNGEAGLAVENIRNWHIGGHNMEVVEYIIDIIAEETRR